MAWRDIPIVVRSEVDGTPQRPYGVADADDLDDILTLVKRWGYHGDDSREQAVGQFTERGFEVVIVEDDD